MRMIRYGKWAAGAIVAMAVLLVFPNPHRPLQGSTSCLSNTKQIMLGMLMYAQDNDCHLPACAAWETDIHPLIRNKQVFECPVAPRGSGPDYAMVSRWSSADLQHIESSFQAVVLYEVAGGQPVLRHPSYERERYDDLYCYLRSSSKPPGMNLGYADGHCKWRSPFPSQVLTEGRDPHALKPPREPSGLDKFRWELRRLFFGHGERASRPRSTC